MFSGSGDFSERRSVAIFFHGLKRHQQSKTNTQELATVYALNRCFGAETGGITQVSNMVTAQHVALRWARFPGTFAVFRAL